MQKLIADGIYLERSLADPPLTIDEAEKLLRRAADAGGCVFVAHEEEGDRLTGYVSAVPGKWLSRSRCASVEGGILTGIDLKVGVELFHLLQKWAESKKVHRLETVVRKENRQKMLFFEQAGFWVEGMRKESLVKDDEFWSEYYLAKFLRR